MFKYKIIPIYEIIPLEIKIENVPLNAKGFADILSINLEYFYKLNRAKNRINDIDSSKWEEIKKITNPYEFIHAFNPKSKYNDNRSVALIKPLSRSFFKMIEIIHEFCPHIVMQDLEKIVSVHIAEGPGGFIEAIRYVRNGCGEGGGGAFKLHKEDLAFGMTLVKYDKNEYRNIHVPGWNKSNQFLFNNPEVYIINGADGTGDVYKTENINYLNDKMRSLCRGSGGGGRDGGGRDGVGGDGANIVTADGGFDFSVEYNYQEQSSCKLIFSQILCAIKCQKKEGIFICKFFDFNSYFTVEMLYLLYTLYESVVIYKPYTSRIANSEKYIICNNFKGIDIVFLDKLFDVLKQWNKYTDKTINYIFEKIPIDFIKKIKEINKEIIDLQVKSINNAIEIIKTNKVANNKNWYDTNIELHIKNAKEWCKKYNIKSKF